MPIHVVKSRCIRLFSFQSLIYTKDNRIPLYFDDVIEDKHGTKYGITRFLVLGTIYHLILAWQESMNSYIHNFTFSVYPEETIYIYSHCCFVKSMNTTWSEERSLREAHFGESYFGSLLKVDVNEASEYSYTDFDIDKPDPEGDSHELQAANSEGVLERENRRQVSEALHMARVKRSGKSACWFSVMSYNIWNMNGRKRRKTEGYTERMQKLQKVRTMAVCSRFNRIYFFSYIHYLQR